MLRILPIPEDIRSSQEETTQYGRTPSERCFEFRKRGHLLKNRAEIQIAWPEDIDQFVYDAILLVFPELIVV